MKAVNQDLSQRSYLPAAGCDLFLPLYDLVTRLLGGEQARQRLIDQAPLQPGDQVLDIGCGTGSLVTMLKQRYPKVEVTGLDPDPKVLALAKRKAYRAGVSAHFDRGFADGLPYPAGVFAAVFSSFMFHHLEAGAREKSLREVRRALKPGGSFYLMDFDASPSGRGHGAFNLFHSAKQLEDNSESRILTLMEQAGFRDRRKIGTQRLLFGFGHAAYYRASAA